MMMCMIQAGGRQRPDDFRQTSCTCRCPSEIGFYTVCCLQLFSSLCAVQPYRYWVSLQGF